MKVQIEQANGSVVTTATTDQKGYFSVTLASGNYLLSVPRMVLSMGGKQQNTFVTIRNGQITTIRIIVDSGMR
jgi:hypothetical protein